MLFRTVAPVRRKGTANHSYQRRIPADVRDRAAGLTLFVPIGDEKVRYTIGEKTETIRLSLRTPIPAEVKHRNGEVDRFFETVWKSLRSSQPIALTRQQCVALAGDVFRACMASERKGVTAIESETLKPGTAWGLIEPPFDPPAAWVAALQAWTRSPSGKMERLALPDAVLDPLEELEHLFGSFVDDALQSRGIGAVDAGSRGLILLEFLRAMRDAWTVQKRQSEGDFSPAPEQNRFPEWQAPKPSAAVDNANVPSRTNGGAKLSLKGLVDRWWSEAKAAGRAQATHTAYNGSINRLAAFLKHDDAQAVTAADVLRFKDHRLAGGVSLATVKDGDLAGLKAIFAFAVSNGLLSSNPAEGVKVLRAKQARTREQGFTSEEAAAILTKSFQHRKGSHENPKTAAAKRWVPWLCAYTGARVGEVVQLRKEDVSHHSVLKVWTITITPEAGTVKNKKVRQVVLHPHLIEQGFADFVKGSKDGYLFLLVKPLEDMRGKWQATKNRLAEFAREVVPDKRVRPNHGWRHRFRTVGREAGIEDSILDAVGGWAAYSMGERYGDVSLAAQAKAFERFPRYDVS